MTGVELIIFVAALTAIMVLVIVLFVHDPTSEPSSDRWCVHCRPETECPKCSPSGDRQAS